MFELVVVGHMDAADTAPGRPGFQPRDVGAGQQGKVGVCRPCGVDADHLCVRFGVDGAGKPVERVAADTGAVGGGASVGVLVKLDAEGQVKRVKALAFEDVAELLDTRLVDYRRVGVGRTGPWLGRVFASLPVYMVQCFGLGVVRLELVVDDRPGRRDAVLVPQFAEVALAQAEQRQAVDLRVAPYEVVQARVELLALGTVPGFRRLVGAVDEHGLGIPVLAGTRQVVAALEHQDAFASCSELLSHRAAAWTAANHDQVVVSVGHC